MTEKVTWKTWSSNLHNDHLILRDVRESMPGNGAMEIHWLVRLLENPKSRWALSGAIDLFDHDCMHVLLGRGMLPQDEAFVIGFCMGADSKLKFWEPALFKLFSRFIYPKIYRFTPKQARIYDIALNLARRSQCRDLHLFDFKGNEHLTIGEVRAMLKIDIRELAKAFAIERQLIPDSRESKRLDVGIMAGGQMA